MLRDQLCTLPIRTTFTRRVLTLVMLAVICSSLGSHTAALGGDLDSAKNAMEKVKVDISNASWDSVDADIKTTEDFLEGLPAGDRAPVQTQLDALKKEAAAGLKDYKSKTIVKSATRNLDAAAENMAVSPMQAGDTIDQVSQTLNSDDAKKYLDVDQLAKLRTRAASLKAMAGSKLANQKLEMVAPIVKELDGAMAAQPFKGVSGGEADKVAQQLAMLVSRINGGLDGVPATDPRVKAINDKIAGYKKQIDAASGNAMADQAAQQLAKYWQGEQQYFTGWEQETTGPSWDAYAHQSGGAISDLNMPKTVELLTRMNSWFGEESVKSTAEQYKDNVSVKATLAEAHKSVDTAAVTLNTAFNNLLSEAEKIETPKDELIRSKPGYLGQRADNWFKATNYRDANVARATRLTAKWNGAVAGANAALDDTMKKVTADAAAAWPGIAGSIAAEDTFTPDKASKYEGKIVHIKGNNRLGWDFQPGDYRYAREINGMAVAAKFDATVAKAVEDAKAKTGQDLPDEAWDFYATVEGPGKIKERSSASGDVKVDGEKVGTVTSEYDKPVDCTVLRIFALHAGPVAVAGPIPSGGFSVMKFLEHLVELLLCLLAAGLVAVKGKPMVAPQVGATASFVAPLLKSDTQAVIGLALAAVGALWLLMTFIVGDLFPATFLTVSGLYLASDILRAKNILPVKFVTPLARFSMPIAGATAVFGVLHVFLAHWWLCMAHL